MSRYVLALLLVVATGACAKSSTTTEPSASASAAASAAPAATTGEVKTATSATMGKILTDASGKTLYVFDKDTATTIACVSPCTGTWPPLTTSGPMASPAMTGLGTRQRPDGTTQVTYKNRPLYRYSGDNKAGDTNGDGVGGIWHVAKVS
jgi:predicted lipoprotein with Yx(FWY)xxD motif